MKSYIILNLTSDCFPYSEFDSVKDRYYLQKELLYFPVYNKDSKTERCLKYSNHKYTWYADEQINKCNHTSSPLMIEKFVEILKVLLADERYNDVKFFVRTNSSSVINIDMLEDCLTFLPTRKCYAGPVNNFGRGYVFIGGTMIIMSRDVAKIFANANVSNLKFWKEDDVVMSLLMCKHHIKGIGIQCGWFDKNLSPSENELTEALSRYVFLRVKNPDRTIDVEIWKRCEKILLEKSFTLGEEEREIISHNVIHPQRLQVETRHTRQLKNLIKKVLFPVFRIFQH